MYKKRTQRKKSMIALAAISRLYWCRACYLPSDALHSAVAICICRVCWKKMFDQKKENGSVWSLNAKNEKSMDRNGKNYGIKDHFQRINHLILIPFYPIIKVDRNRIVNFWSQNINWWLSQVNMWYELTKWIHTITVIHSLSSRFYL